MPVALAHKVEALCVDFRSAARLADMLGVSRSQVTRWLRGSGIDPLNAEKVDLLELVWSNLLRLYDKDAALAWLFGLNPLLGDRRPIDLIRMPARRLWSRSRGSGTQAPPIERFRRFGAGLRSDACYPTSTTCPRLVTGGSPPCPPIAPLAAAPADHLSGTALAPGLAGRSRPAPGRSR